MNLTKKEFFQLIRLVDYKIYKLECKGTDYSEDVKEYKNLQDKLKKIYYTY